MKKAWCILVCLLLTAAMVWAVGETDGNKYDSAYKKAKIKSRARLQAEKKADEIAGTKYVFVDDDEIDEEIEKQKGQGQFEIGTVKLNKEQNVRQLQVYMKGDTQKEIKLNKEVGEKGKVEIGTAKVEEGAKLKKVKSIIELQLEVDDE